MMVLFLVECKGISLRNRRSFLPVGKLQFRDGPRGCHFANKDDLKIAIFFPRKYIRDLKLPPSWLQYLSEETIRDVCQGHCAEIFANEVARAANPLDGSQVTFGEMGIVGKPSYTRLFEFDIFFWCVKSNSTTKYMCITK